MTFKMDGTSCVKLSTSRGEWVQMYFQNGNNGCAAGSSSGSMGELRYFDHPECRQNEWRNVVNQMEVGTHFAGDGGMCFNDRGASPGIVYYRTFCDIAPPSVPVPVPILITNNITQVMLETRNVVNNITTFVPTIVKPDDLIPLIQSLMKTNASLFKPLSVSPVSAPSLINSSSVSSPSLINSSSVNGPTNEQKQQSSGLRLDVPLLIFAGVPVLFFFLLV